MPLIVENVVGGYVPEVDILNGVSIHVEDEAVTCIVGPNGAGKSTLLQTIYGFLKPKRGKILLDHENIIGIDSHEMLGKGIGYLFQRRHIFPNLTVHENLKMGVWILRKRKDEITERINEVYTRFQILRDKKDERAKTLSGGMQRMLELARVLIVEPKVILVDEPTAGLAPKVAMSIYEEIKKLKDEGKTFLMVDQNVKQAVLLADYVYVMQHGQVIAEGPSEKFRKKLTSLVSGWLI